MAKKNSIGKRGNSLRKTSEKKDSFLNKRGEEPLMEQIVFFIIIIAFAVIMITFVIRTGSRAAMGEEIYAKQIALAIDKSIPGTNIIMDVSQIYSYGRKNNIQNGLILIDNNENKVIMHLAPGKGYSFVFFNSYPISWNINDSVRGEEKLILNIG